MTTPVADARVKLCFLAVCRRPGDGQYGCIAGLAVLMKVFVSEANSMYVTWAPASLDAEPDLVYESSHAVLLPTLFLGREASARFTFIASISIRESSSFHEEGVRMGLLAAEGSRSETGRVGGIGVRLQCFAGRSGRSRRPRTNQGQRCPCLRLARCRISPQDWIIWQPAALLMLSASKPAERYSALRIKHPFWHASEL